MKSVPTVRRSILITGATDGIGLAYARRLHEQGERLLLIGRKPLESLSAPFFQPDSYCQADLSMPDCSARVLRFLDALGIAALDRVVHNAAVGFYGPVSRQPFDSLAAVMETNLVAPISLTHALLPRLEAASGTVCFVSSVVAALPGKQYAVYTATKAALEGFARNLRIETKGRVRVQIIRPGATHTGFHKKMGLDREVMDWERFSPVDRVAEQMDAAIERNRDAATLGLGNMLIHGSGRYLPWFVDPLSRMRSGTEAVIDPVDSSGRPRCVITGAADGIGRALAHRFATAGYDIVGIDCDAAKAAVVKDELTAQGARASFILADLASPADRERVLDDLAAGPSVDVFVHNAGISAAGYFESMPFEKQRTVLSVNLAAPMHLTAGLLQRELITRGAALVFMASLSCYTGYPGAAVYGASKDGLSAYARSLSAAIHPHVRVLTVYPGPVRTAHAERYSPDNRRADRRMPPATLADAIFRAVRWRRRTLVPGLVNRLTAMTGHWYPGLMEYAMRKAILEKLDSPRPVTPSAKR